MFPDTMLFLRCFMFLDFRKNAILEKSNGIKSNKVYIFLKEQVSAFQNRFNHVRKTSVDDSMTSRLAIVIQRNRV